MPTYKGNVGNLMQHWTLCELLSIAQDRGIPGLNFIDAHAMAPLARQQEPPVGRDGRYNRVADRVQHPQRPDHEWASKYEWAWHHLAPSVGYPNSAVFVEKVWRGNFAMSLCEMDWTTLGELGAWCDLVRSLERCTNAQFFPGDWRETFDQGLPTPRDVDLPEGSLTLVSFDPDLVSWHPRPNQLGRQQSRTVYPQDLEDVRNQLINFDGRVLIYLPTYSAQNNSQREVIPAVDEILMPDPHGFTRYDPIRVDGHNMSLVYARGLDDWAAQLRALPARFKAWYHAIRPLR